MHKDRFDGLAKAMAKGTNRRSVLKGLVGGAAAVVGVKATSTLAQNAGKVDICHSLGNGGYNLINVNRNALDAHLAHGDGEVGAPVPDMAGYVFGEDCTPVSDVVCQTVISSQLNYSATGWGGWSCPEGTTVLDASIDLVDAKLYLWYPGADPVAGGPTYPNTLHGYTYHEGWTPPEEGAIAQAGGTAGPAFITLTCCGPA